jgi:hypothetical protein
MPKNKTKIIIKTRNKNKPTVKKRKYVNRTSISNHRYLIRERFVLSYDNYSVQNLNIPISDNLENNKIFTSFQKLYQYYKIANIKLEFQPILKEGTQPPNGYVVFIGNQSLPIDYAYIPILPYAKHISPQKKTSFLFTRPGRQNDFNYWFNTREETSTDGTISANFRLRFDQPFAENGSYYILIMSIDIRFDKPFVSDSDQTKTEKEIAEKIIANADKSILIDKDEEEFNKAFEADPSDDEDKEQK